MSLRADPFLAMASNNAWANATLYGAVQGMSETVFTAKRPGFFDSLALTLNHIYEVDLYYIDALTEGGKGRSVYDRQDILDPAILAKAQADVDAQFIAFAKTLTPDRLHDARQTERKNEMVSETVGTLFLHLIQHQIHHRGQAHTQLLDAGIDPPKLDDFYLTFGRVPSAAAYWEDAS